MCSTDNLGFTRAAANDGIHGEDEIAINDIPRTVKMGNCIRRMIRKTVTVARRDPKRTAEFVTDALMLLGLLTLVYIAWDSCRGCA